MVQRPRGTRDFAPDAMAVREEAGRRMRKVFRAFGYREVQTPAFEDLALFTAKSGPGIVDELYAFKDKAGRDLCLRPELTAPVMRMYFEGHRMDPKPVKWFYFGNCFRYDRPQSGRYREFWQFGCEQIGSGTPFAYAELVALAVALLDAVGLEERTVGVGHVALLGRLVDALGVDADARAQAMRLIDKDDRQGLHNHLDGAGADSGAAARLVAAMDAADVGAARDALGEDPALDELDEVLSHVADLGVADARLDLGIARGLDYYTGVVFEVHCPLLEAQSQILGGGGYDLSAVFGAEATPTMGFGLGFDRTLVALEAQGADLVRPAPPSVYLGALSEGARTVVARTAAVLRRHGVIADLDLLDRKPAQIAKAADASGAQVLVIVGDRDLEAGTVQAKRLATGKSDEVGVDGLADWLVEQLGGLDMHDYN